VGALVDLAGNDKYRTGSVSQGFGGTLGTGILVDVAGNDRYVADLDGRRQGIYRNQSVSFVQGSGCGRRADFGDGHSLGGGFGILIDGAGDDFYESGAYGQGNAYWWSMGILEDRGGDDTHRMMQYGLGTAPHFAIGVCVNLAGDDSYNIDYPVMQRYLGHGRDGSIGVFIDGDGNDRYAITCDSGGHADLNTLALFWDRRGDDEYNLIPSSGKLRGHGSVQSYSRFRTFRDAMPSVGIFLDTGGRDRYLDRPEWRGAKEKGLANPGADDTWWQDLENASKTRFGLGWDLELYPRASGD
jgi:hypothetical protein